MKNQNLIKSLIDQLGNDYLNNPQGYIIKLWDPEIGDYYLPALRSDKPNLPDALEDMFSQFLKMEPSCNYDDWDDFKDSQDSLKIHLFIPITIKTIIIKF